VETLVDLAATYLDFQARLWLELVGTPAVPVSIPAKVQPMGDAFRRGDTIQPLGVGY